MTITIDKIVRSKRKTISLLVTAEGELIVRAPHKLSEASIHAFVEQKAGWVENKQAMMETRRLLHRPPLFEEGEMILYLGHYYRLTRSHRHGDVTAADDCLYIPMHTTDLKQAVLAWYRQEAARLFPRRAELYSHSMGVGPTSLRISEAARRWGSCSSKGAVNLSWKLIMCPLPVIDYVVVHELAHLKHHDHSSHFWALVKKTTPDCDQYRQWLKDNVRILTLV
jgi:predicted metal-dependent hydrolase